MENEASYSLNKPPADSRNSEKKGSGGYASMSMPQITLPKGGGSIRSIDDKFSVNAANGTAGFSIPFPLSPSRNGFMPSMSLSYNSGDGNSIFGLGWNGQPAAIARKTEKKLPEYRDAEGSDIFIFSGAEDLVPAYYKDEAGNWIKDSRVIDGLTIDRYRPRIENGFARIEKVREENGNIYWKVTSATNIVSVYGKSRIAQISDPADPAKIFKWLFEFSYDDKGNCFRLGYKKENKVNIPDLLHERNRLNDLSPCTNVYLKSIKYCNKDHFRRSSIDWQDWDGFLDGIEYLLELVLDYGEHDLDDPQPDDDRGWSYRPDAFSDYRAGFEIRTCRLCRRMLMFHHFSELGDRPCLVNALDLEYDAGTAFTFLRSATQKGYIRRQDGAWSIAAIPSMDFNYEPLGWNTTVNTLPASGLENLPAGIDDKVYQWIDLNNEGISGILTEQAGGWYYKSNAGDGNLEGMQLVASRPSLNGLSDGSLHFQDLEARGQKFLVSRELKGYYELGDDNAWLPFKNFIGNPNIDLHDPNLKMLDLNGDGMADILISEDEVFTWYASKGTEGFESHRRIAKAFDEEKGPNIVFADSTQSLVLADMSGDGLMDIVRVCYNEVVYWPNLGYGRFGAKINMSNAPLFDRPEDFNPHYIRLADLDGSGIPDIIYLGQDTFKIYFNQAGNGWSRENLVQGVNPLPFPKIDEQVSVNIIDLLGAGTGCIVWSSSLPQSTGNPLYYIDLMNGKKPHVMTAYSNNMGKEVSIQYKPSTYFYLADKKEGTPWVTKLPFPVQCVSQTAMIDQVRRSRFTTQYTYHHGYYDHAEREFRGFGRVDHTDTEDFENYRKFSDPDGVIQLVDEGFHEPPVLTKTWFHTGAFLDKEKIFSQFAHEYYRPPLLPEKELTDPILQDVMTVDEWREALRACKGLPLRIEVYSPDGSDRQDQPYTTSHQSCLIRVLQPRLQNQFAVFDVQESELLTYTYERNPADPRIGHTMTIQADEFGNIQKTATISYGRRSIDATLTAAEQAEQAKTHMVFSENKYTNFINTAADYLLPLGYEEKTCELTGLNPATGEYFTITELAEDFGQATEIAYQTLPTDGTKQKRLIEQVRTTFLKNDLSGPLDLGVMESLALPCQSYKLSLTPALRDFIFGNKVNDQLLMNEGNYVHLNDDNYWIASGIYSMDPDNFYQVTEVTDPFGSKAQVTYDSAYRFFIQQTTDALGNNSKVLGFNYRVLTPWLMSDTNDNRTGVRTDELGMVVSTFLMGKEEENKGDLMDTASIEHSPADRPGSTMEYDLFNYKNTGKPNFVKTTVNETHFYDINNVTPILTQISYGYVDGSGGTMMQKKQAQPGLALQENPDGTVTEVDTTPALRWIGNGRSLLNNKGKPVKQYEPYFSTTFEFEEAKLLVERGVTAVITYDSVGRAIRTDMPDGTFTKTEFDAWTHRSFDPNDTVLDSTWYKDRILAPIPAIATAEEMAAANKAAAHANTPAIAYLDSLGRDFVTIADNGTAGIYKTVTETDIEGNARRLTDAKGNLSVQYKYDMLGAQLYSLSLDAGERWTVNDVMGKPLRGFDSLGHLLRYEYDSLRRPVKIFVQQPGKAEVNTEKVVYGEGLSNDKQLNLRGRIYQYFDGAGVVTHLQADFKGNSLSGSRQLLKDYRNIADWNLLTTDDLDPALYSSSGTFDALNRPEQMQTPDGSIMRPVYNEAGVLNQAYISIKGTAETQFVKDVNYNARGQRESILYTNATSTHYQYDPKTFRLARLLTTGKNGTDLLQQLHYTYDPAGNITSVKDEAQQTLFFNNSIVAPSSEYTYDAIYRLVSASGREHIGQNQPPTPKDEFRTNLPMPGDGAAMRNYTQSYQYDAVGNILQMAHAAGAGSWTRTYNYDPNGNRLTNTIIGNNTENYTYDAHGSILSLNHLQTLNWNFRDQLQTADLGGGGTAYYVYDASGQRIRKVIERLDGSKEERIYFGELEVYKKTNSAAVVEDETETLFVTDNSRRLVIIETKTIEGGLPVAPGNLQPLIRYQYSNHLASSSLELDEQARIISYEEYYPFGATSYQAMNAAINAAVKRYRYTGMERDEETGLEYHSARHYLPWLGRWLSADPIGIKGGLNLYAYCDNRVVVGSDPSGNLIWFIVIATAVFLLADDAQPANAPGFREPTEQEIIQKQLAALGDAKKLAEANARVAVKTYPRHSEYEMPIKGVIMMASAGAGGAAAGLVNGGKGLLAGGVNLAVFGASDAVGNLGYSDAKRHELSSFSDYASTAGKGAVISVVVGGVVHVAGKTLGKPSFKPGDIAEPPAGSSGAAPKKGPVIVVLGKDKISRVSAKVMSKKTGFPVVKLKPGSLKGVTEATAFGHGVTSSPKNLLLGATRVTIGGVNVTAEGYANAFAEAGWEGGILRMASCQTGLPNEFGSIYGEEVANEFGYLGKETTTLSPEGQVDILHGEFKATATNGMPSVIRVDPVTGDACYLATGKGWRVNTQTLEKPTN